MKYSKLVVPVTFLVLIVVLAMFFFQGQSDTAPAAETPKAATKTVAEMTDDKGPTVGVNLTLSPVFMNLVAQPSSNTSAQFKVSNNNPIPEKLKLTLVKFKADSTGAHPVPEDVTPADDFAKWVSFSEKNFTLEPNQTKAITVSVKTPEEAQFGYYFAVMVTRESERKDEKGTVLTGAPTMPILLEVKSPLARKQLELVKFEATSKFYEYLPAEFNITLKNTGNVHVVPAGDIFIDKGSTKDVGTITTNMTQGNILPNTTRTYTTMWDDGFIVRKPKKTADGTLVTDSKGNVKYETAMDWSQISKLRMGKYTANLVLVYFDGTRDVPVEAQTSFWVIPWKIIVIVGLTLFLIGHGVVTSIMGMRPTTGSGKKSKKSKNA